MSNNQRVRLFVASRDLLKALCRKNVDQKALAAAGSALRVELDLAMKARPQMRAAVNTGYSVDMLN